MRGVQVREKDGAWYVFANHRGSRRAKRVGPGKDGKALAEKLAKQWSAALTLGQAATVFAPTVEAPIIKGKSKAITVAAAFEPWVTARIKGGDLRESSGAVYRSAMATWILPAIGNIPVDQVTREQVGGIITKAKTAGRSRSIIGHILKAARGLFAALADDKIISMDPTLDLKRYIGRGGKRKVRPITEQDIFSQHDTSVLLRAAQATNPRLYPVLAFLLGTGCRPGEVWALTKDDVNLRGRDGYAGEVSITKSWSRNLRVLTGTKTDKPRTIPLSKELVVILRDWFDVRKAEGWGDLELVFPGEENRHRKSWHVIWKTLIKRSRLRYRPVRATRHTFASRALKAQIRPVLVQRWLGHSSLVLTLDTYARFVPDDEADVRDAARLGSLVEC